MLGKLIIGKFSSHCMQNFFLVPKETEMGTEINNLHLSLTMPCCVLSQRDQKFRIKKHNAINFSQVLQKRCDPLVISQQIFLPSERLYKCNTHKCCYCISAFFHIKKNPSNMGLTNWCSTFNTSHRGQAACSCSSCSKCPSA